MAQQVTVSLIDDLNGSTADETVEFGMDGKIYEIDLSNSNAEKLREVFVAYVTVARRSGERRRSTGVGSTERRPTVTDRQQSQAVRDWARQQGMKVSDRGRLPADLLNAYHSAVPS